MHVSQVSTFLYFSLMIIPLTRLFVEGEDFALPRILFFSGVHIPTPYRKSKSKTLQKINPFLFSFSHRKKLLHGTLKKWATQKIKTIFTLYSETSHYTKCSHMFSVFVSSIFLINKTYLLTLRACSFAYWEFIRR